MDSHAKNEEAVKLILVQTHQLPLRLKYSH